MSILWSTFQDHEILSVAWEKVWIQKHGNVRVHEQPIKPSVFSVVGMDDGIRAYFGLRNSIGMHSCRGCEFVCKYTSNLRAHVESKHYSPGYLCRRCGQYFKIKNSHFAHEKTCFFKILQWIQSFKYIIADILDPRLKEYFGRDNGTHFCLACGHVCQTSSNLRAHVESKHYSPGYNCRFCEKSFRLRNSRAAHEKKHGLHRSSQLQLLQ